jgi:hypothetical protein
VTLLVVVLAGWGAALLVGPSRLVIPVGAALVVPAALLATAGAAVSIVMGPPTADNLMLPVEVAGVKMLWRVVWAPILVLLGLTPVFVARSAMRHHLKPGPAAVSGSVFPIMLGVLALAWLRYREQAHEWIQPPDKTAGPT